MTVPTSEDLRAAASNRRRALFALGTAGIAAAFAGAASTSAKQSPGKKRKKRCNKQKQECTTQVTAFCASTGEVTTCQNALLPCCVTCDLPTAMVCAAQATFGVD